MVLKADHFATFLTAEILPLANKPKNSIQSGEVVE